MVDPRAAQLIIRQLHRWYRRRAQPRGTMDHYHRGTRMSYTAVYRRAAACFCLMLVGVAAVLYFVPGPGKENSTTVVLLFKLGAVGLVALALFTALQAFREFAVITDDELIKFNPFGRETRMAWRDIYSYQIKPDNNTVTFKTSAKASLKLSLAYDGWQDLREMAARRMNPALYWQFAHALVNVDARRAISTAKINPAKWLRKRKTDATQAGTTGKN